MSDDETTLETSEATSADAAAEGETSPDAPILPDGEADASADASAPEAKPEPTPEEAEKAARRDARLKAADEAERAAEARRAERRKQVEAQEREQRILARERAAEEAIRTVQQQAQEVAALRERILGGGPEALEAIGTSFDKLTHQYLEANTPEAIAKRALERAEALERKLEDERKAAALERRREMQAREVQASRERFEAFLDGNAADFPHAADMAPSLLHREAADIAVAYAKEFGSDIDFPSLAVRLDERARILQEEAQTRRAKRAPSSTTPSDGAPPHPQATPPGQSASRPAPRTLPNAVAGTRATPKRPMTDAEIDEWALAELRQALATDRKATA